MAEDLELLLIRMEAGYKRFENDLKRMSGAYDRETRKIERRQADLARRLNSSVAGFGRTLVPSLGALAAGLSSREIIRYADAWTDAGNKIAASGTPLEEQGQRLRQLADVAVETRSAFEGTIATYSRLQRSTAELGVSEQALLKYTDTINKAFIVGGAAASERAAGILQLSQGIASGFLAGDELRSVRENAPLIAKAIADVMGVSIGGLKELGAQGKITVDVILKALDRLGPKVNEAFGKTQLTVGQALDNLETRFTQFVGGLSESGAMAGIASGINFVAENLDLLAKAAAVAAIALAPAGLAGAAGVASRAVGILSAAILANPLGVFTIVALAAASALLLYTDRSQGAVMAERALAKARADGVHPGRQAKDATDELAKSRRQLTLDTKNATLAEQQLAAELLKKRAYAEYLARRNTFNPVDEGTFRLMTSMSDTDFEGFLKKNVLSSDGRQRLRDYRAALAAVEQEALKTEGSISKLLNMSDAEFEAQGTASLPGAALTGKGKGDAWTRALAQIEKQTAAFEARATAADRSVQAMEYAEQAARLLIAAEEAGIPVTEKVLAQIRDKAMAYAQAKAASGVEDAIGATDEAIRALEQEAEALGLGSAAADTLRFKQQLMNEVLEQTGEISAATAARIEAAAEQYGRVREKVEDATRAMEDQIALQDGVRQGFLDIGLAASRGADDFGDALGDMARRIADLVLELYVLKPLMESLFGAMGTSGGGSLGGLLGQALGSLGGAAAAGGGGSMPLMAKGGVTRGPSIAGERGAEAVVPLPDGRRIPVDLQLPQIPVPSGGGKGGGVTVQVVNNAPVQVETRAARDSGGRPLVELVINEVKKDFANGGFDKAQAARFGLKPARTRR